MIQFTDIEGRNTVSVIVPIYNVENYLSKCIRSIVEQSHSQLEILLVVDGSPDASGRIADEWSKKDDRIRTFHTENRGVSAARNLGIQEASGDYIIFVDADDFLASDFVDYMCELVKETGADFVMSKNCFWFPNRHEDTGGDSKIVEIYSSEQAAAELLLPGKIDIGCWNKMFKRTLLLDHNICFPTNYFMGEGLNFIILAAQFSKQVAVGSKRVYYYRKDNEASATTAASAKKYLNALKALDRIEASQVLQSKLTSHALRLHRCMTTYTLLRVIYETDSLNDYRSEYMHHLSFVRRNVLCFSFSCVKLRYKLFFLLCSGSPMCASRLETFLRLIWFRIKRAD